MTSNQTSPGFKPDEKIMFRLQSCKANRLLLGVAGVGKSGMLAALVEKIRNGEIANIAPAPPSVSTFKTGASVDHICG